MSTIIFFIPFLLMTSAELLGKSVVIPGTTLRTGHYYSMSMTKFPDGFVSWVNSSAEQIDNCYIKVYKDSKSTNVEETNKEWAFIPAVDEVNWYHLVNRGRPGEVASWGKIKSADGNTSFVLVLKFPTNGVADHYLFRPEVPIKVNVLPDRYQLKLKSAPFAHIKWINVDGSIHLEVEQLRNRTKYDEYTEEFMKTLFIISGDHGTYHTFAGAYALSVNLTFLIISTFITLLFAAFISK